MISFDKESQTRVLRVAELRVAGKPVDDDDDQIVQIMELHPEFDEIWPQGELACYPQEIDGKIVNPFVHTVLHVRIDMQIISQDPSFVGEAFKHLQDQGLDAHNSLHVIMGEYADIYFGNFRQGRAFDNLAYQARVCALDFQKNED